MKFPVKLAISAAVLVMAGFATAQLAPIATLMANPIIVGQMANSDKAAAAAHVVGSGDWAVTAVVWGLAFLVLALVWMGKEGGKKGGSK